MKLLLFIIIALLTQNIFLAKIRGKAAKLRKNRVSMVGRLMESCISGFENQCAEGLLCSSREKDGTNNKCRGLEDYNCTENKHCANGYSCQHKGKYCEKKLDPL